MRIGARFPKLPAKNWRKRKACAVIANRNQFENEYEPEYTTAIEIVTGEGYGIRLESTEVNTPTLIIREA